jgi:hypothetical protein
MEQTHTYAKFDDFRHQTYTVAVAEVAELADAHDSNSCGVTLVGSSPTFGTESGNGLLINGRPFPYLPQRL